MTFRTIPNDGYPLRVILVGVGAMGQAWLQAIADCPEVELVGVVDLDIEAATAVAAALRKNVAVGTDSVEIARNSGGQAVIDVTIPAAHHAVTIAALFGGLPVLGEKPVASTVAQGLSLAAAADVTGELFMVSQSRRYNEQVWRFKEQISMLGRPGVLTTEFFKAPHFGGFREEMDHPLLLDMAIHPLDTARFLLEGDPVSVYCQEYNPSWSWYRGDAGCTAIFEMRDSAQYIFTGSWCSPGLETSWNGLWRASGEFGSARWNGDDAPEVEIPSDSTVLTTATDHSGSHGKLRGEGIAGSLREFVGSLRTGVLPMGEVHGNILSLAMVEAAIESNRTGRRILIDTILSAELDEAVSGERTKEVGLVLRAWRTRAASPGWLRR